ncbi:hypothetical protein BDZ89DRAFT_1154009 [Hymenopellis radicata]|nr:hypothetical protein BDZ89DRAFT_1154009 [Hymenopellis radicata]
MSHSTTATSTFNLQKYSRSYPNLSVDSKNASNGELESVRLRIVWTMDNGDAMNTNQIVFEDLELLAFASLPFRNPQKQSHGLPLKAVYRDTVVGMRYLHPREFNTAPTYRRFQMTFTAAAAATQFINAIRNVCPCKLNGTAAEPLPVSVHVQQAGASESQFLEPQYPRAPLQWNGRQSLPIMVPESQFSTEAYRVPPTPARVPVSNTPPSHWPIDASMRSQTICPPAFLPLDPPLSQDITQQPTLSSSPALANQNMMTTDAIAPAPAPHMQSSFTLTEISSGLVASAPASSQTPFSASPAFPPQNTSIPPPTQLPSRLSAPESAPLLPPPDRVPLDKLTTTELYNLSPAQLKSYAEEIVQEHGFSDLLNALSSSWTLKKQILRTA